MLARFFALLPCYHSPKRPYPNPPVLAFQRMVKLPIRLLPVISRIKLADHMEVVPPPFTEFIGKGAGQPEPVPLFLGNVDSALDYLLD